MRLGELLVNEGLVTPAQVEAALGSQILHGGRLGSNLVELGCISMEALAKALGRLHQKPAALEKHYLRIDQALAARLTPELAAAWNAVPLARVGPASTEVVIATTDPFSSDVLYELQAIFNADIIESIAPEMRLYYWLEEVYHIARLNRFKRISHGDEPELALEDDQRAADTEADDVDDSDFSDSEVTDARRSYVKTLSEVEPVATSNLAKIAVKRIAVPISGEIEVPLDPDNWKSCMRSIRQSKDRERIAKVVTYVLQEGFAGIFSAGMLMITKEELALGWSGFVRGIEHVFVEDLALSLQAESMMAAPYTNKESFFGIPASPSTLDLRFWHYLGSTPVELAILPVVVLGEVACLLYVQSDSVIPPDKVGALGDVSRAISAAITRLIRAASR